MEESNELKLNLGCGYNHERNHLNVDRDPHSHPDLELDLESFPWPWADNSVSEIKWIHSLEHLGETTALWRSLVQEMYRVCRNGAVIFIRVPHPNHDTFNIDPTHVRAIFPETFLMLDQARNIADRANGGRETNLGIQWSVDFQVLDVRYSLEEPWRTQFQNGKIDLEQLRKDMSHLKNVCREIDFVVKVVKPGRASLATQKTRAEVSLQKSGPVGPTWPQVPQHLLQTLEWLILTDQFGVARSVVLGIEKFLPADQPGTKDFVAHFLHRSKFYVEAVDRALQTVELLPTSLAAKFNLAKCLHSAAKTAEAERIMREVCEGAPNWLDPKVDLAVYVCALGRRDEAMSWLESLRASLPENDPNQKIIDFNLGWHYIRRGEFRRGMKGLSQGRALRIWGAYAHKFSVPKLEPGQDVKGKTVLLVGEGGAGDEIINVRFATVIRQRGGKAIWLSNHGFAKMFSRHPDLLAAYDRAPGEGAETNIPIRIDLWAPAMDLPSLLDLDLADVGSSPYLSANKDHLLKWEKLLPRKEQSLKVGLRWQGNALYEHDLLRSIRLTELEKALRETGLALDLYSLQRDEGVEQLSEVATVTDLSHKFADWEETAAAIMQMDLVISTCTSVVHLAAALGKRTWLLCPLNTYYVWISPGETSPWYSNLRLFRQTRINSWQDVLEDLKLALQELPIFNQQKISTENSENNLNLT